jgi:hypothetical protein
MSEQLLNQNINSVFSKEILEELKKLLGQMSAITVQFAAALPNTAAGKLPSNNTDQNDSMNSLTGLMLNNFEGMLSSTAGMMKNMGAMEGGFAGLVQIILQIITSLKGGSAGGGIFGALFGTIFGLIGGPLGAAIGSGIGGVLGSFSSHSGMPRRGANSPQFPVNGFTVGNTKTINQIIIKNPVTFSRAFEVEVRNQSIRGPIDL